MVNNWKAAQALDHFRREYLDPSTKETLEARKVLNDTNFKWKKGQKERAKEKFQRMEGENINLHRIYNAFRELIDDHEGQTDMLTEIYSEWYHKISTDGVQPVEMMRMQQEILQGIWRRIFAEIEPLQLELKSPKDGDKV